MPQSSRKSENLALLVLFHFLHLGPHFTLAVLPDRTAWDKQQTTNLEPSSWRWRCSFSKLQVNASQPPFSLGNLTTVTQEVPLFPFLLVFSAAGALSEVSLGTKHFLLTDDCAPAVITLVYSEVFKKSHPFKCWWIETALCGRATEHMQPLGAWVENCNSELPTALHRIKFSTAAGTF